MPNHPSTPKDPVYEFVLHIKLIFVLLKEKSISPLLKILPFAGLIYLLLPFKMFFPLDFLLVLFLGGYLFIEFCPEKTVVDGLTKLRSIIPGEAKEIPPQDVSDSKPIKS